MLRNVIICAFGLATVQASSFVVGDTPGVIELPVRKLTNIDSLVKRDSETDGILADLSNAVYLYYIDIEIGTPTQSFSAQVDTGSADLWVMNEGNPYCEGSDGSIPSSYQVDCKDFSLFSPDNSSTFENLSTSFSVSYGDTTFASGVWVTDNVEISGITVQNVTFGLANEFNTTEPLLGVGFPSLDSNGDYLYDNFPMMLQKQGLIDTVSYSLYLDDLDATNGTLLFGGYDSERFEGDLKTLPMTPDSDGFISYLGVEMTGLVWNIESESNITLLSGSEPVVLDSGTSFTGLPSGAVDSIIESLGGEEQNGNYYVACDEADVAGSLSFWFNDVSIEVPFSELLLNSSGKALKDGRDACQLTLAGQDDGAILGDSFLRSAYVVYDLTNKEISIAQAKYGSESSNIIVIDSDGVQTVDSEATSYNISATGFTVISSTVSVPSASASFSTTTSRGDAPMGKTTLFCFTPLAAVIYMIL